MSLLENINSFFNANKHIGILLFRVFIGLRLLYGVVDNVFSWEQMVGFSQFLEQLQFPLPIVSAIVSVYVQFIGSILILVGYRTRLTSFVLVINFVIALVFVHVRIGDSIEGMTPALAMLFGCLTLLFTGADKLSFDERAKK